MKNWWIVLFFISSVLSSEESWQPLPAPMLSLEERYPVELNDKEQRALKERNEAKRNVALFKEREVPWFSLFLVGAAILYVIFGGRKEKPRELSKEEIEKTLQEETIIKLQQLKMEKKTPDQFYVELTQILRSYIEQFYGLPAETSTTEEFFNKVQTDKALVKLDSQGLSEFMQSADRVKFARQDATEEDLRRALEYAISFIRKSTTF